MSPLQHPHRQVFASMFGLQTMAEGGEPAPAGGIGSGRNAAEPRVGLQNIYQELAVSALRRNEPLTMGIFGFEGWPAAARLYGWGVVERTMTEVTRVLMGTFRASDVVARWREDEIAVLMPRTDVAGGVRALEKAFRSLAGHGVLRFAEGWVEVGVAAGISSIAPGAPFSTAIEDSSAQLHLARRAGPGRIRWEGGERIALGGRIAVVDPGGVLVPANEVFLRLGGEVMRARDVGQLLDEPTGGIALVVLVLDTESNGTNGFQDLQRLREDPALRECPIVVVGAHSDELPMSFELGADDFLVHPVAPMELGARVRRLLGRRRLSSPPRT